MAKKKAVTVNKSQAVLDYLQMHPEATATIVIPALAKKGITVSQGLVNNTRSRLKKARATNKSAPKKRVARKKATRKKVTRPSVLSLSANDLFEAKKLVDKLGNLDGARKAIETLEQLR